MVFTISVAPQTTMATIGISQIPRSSIDLMSQFLPHREELSPNGSFRALFTQHDKLGGADRDRTGGLLVANQALSQLSYSPKLALSFQPLAFSLKR